MTEGALYTQKQSAHFFGAENRVLYFTNGASFLGAKGVDRGGRGFWGRGVPGFCRPWGQRVHLFPPPKPPNLGAEGPYIPKSRESISGLRIVLGRLISEIIAFFHFEGKRTCPKMILATLDVSQSTYLTAALDQTPPCHTPNLPKFIQCVTYKK